MGKSLQAAADNSHYTAFPDLGLSPIALHLGPFDLRWYSLAYLAGIFIGYWYLLKLLKEPGAPLARRHADDLVFYAALGIILGGRIGYVLFYNLGEYLKHPIEILKLWDGGMSFHGGVIGTSLGAGLRRHDLRAVVRRAGARGCRLEGHAERQVAVQDFRHDQSAHRKCLHRPEG